LLAGQDPESVRCSRDRPRTDLAEANRRRPPWCRRCAERCDLAELGDQPAEKRGCLPVAEAVQRRDVADAALTKEEADMVAEVRTAVRRTAGEEKAAALAAENGCAPAAGLPRWITKCRKQYGRLRQR
jgi:hypothetical protein